MRTLYACQKCGEEVGEGEKDINGRCPYCLSWSLDPIGVCDDDDDSETPDQQAKPAVTEETSIKKSEIRLSSRKI